MQYEMYNSYFVQKVYRTENKTVDPQPKQVGGHVPRDLRLRLVHQQPHWLLLISVTVSSDKTASDLQRIAR